MRSIAMLVLMCLLVAGKVFAFHPMSVDWAVPSDNWHTLETPYFLVHYRQSHAQIAKRVASLAEIAHVRLSATYNWVPLEKTDVVIADNYDLANGWATVWPSNQIRLYLSAPDDLNTLENYDDWLELLITHEYTHIIHLDKASAAPRFLRRIFGRNFWLFPNSYQPLFMIEGLAIHEESDAEHHHGRSFSSLYSGMMQAQVDAGVRSIAEVSVASRRWPSGDGYLYGAFFYQFLAEIYGPRAAAGFIELYSRNIIPFSMNRTASRYFGKDFHLLWDEYQQWLEQQFPTSNAPAPGEALFVHGQNSIAPVAAAEGAYYSWQDGHGIPQLMQYGSDGQAQAITELKYPGIFDLKDNGEVLLASVRSRQENRLWSDLYHYNGKNWRRLTHDGRYREARWLGDHILARRMQDGIAGLDLLDTQGVLIRTLWQGRDGEVLGRIAISPDHEQMVAAYKPIRRSWQLARIDIQDGQLTLLSDNRWHQAQPSYAKDGSLLYSADYNGRFNLYRMDMASGRLSQLTDVATAALNPVQDGQGKIYFEYLSAEGYRLHRLQIDERSSLSASDVVLNGNMTVSAESPQSSGDGDAGHWATYPYTPWHSLRPRWWLPMLAATEESTLFGVMTGGSDSLKQHRYELALGYESKTGEPAGSLLYQFSNRYQLYAQRSLSYYLDEEDALQAIRASDTFSVTRINLLNTWDNQLTFQFGMFMEEEHDRYLRNDVASRPSQERGLIGAALVFDTSQAFRHSISPAYGRRISIIAESNQLLDKNYDGHLYSAAIQQYLHLGQSHVLALGLAGSYGDDNTKAFRLHDGSGGYRPSFLGRDHYRLRGYADNRIVAQDAALASVEWRFPLARIQRNWHTYPIGLRDLHGALFADTAAVWRPRGIAREGKFYTGIGAELTTELMLAYQLPLPITLGVAKGLDEELGEVRGYLRMGLSF